MTQELEAALHPLGLVWLALIYLSLRWLLRREFGPFIAAATLAAFLYATGSTSLAFYLVTELERPFDPTGKPPPVKADAIVMLGGAHDYASRSPLKIGAVEATDRILAAVELIRQGRAGALVLGGSHYELQGQRRPDSELITQWLQLWRLPTGKVYPLGICLDSHDEAVRTASLAAEHKWRRIILVTSGSHLRRAVATFQKAGLTVEPYGAEFPGLEKMDHGWKWLVVPRPNAFDQFRTWIHEQVGWWYYQYKGWI